MRSIQIMRVNVEKWLSEPHFEETLPGCLIRMKDVEYKAGKEVPIYRIFQILKIERKKGDSYYYKYFLLLF